VTGLDEESCQLIKLGGGEEELPLLSKNEDFCPSTSLSWYSTIYC